MNKPDELTPEERRRELARIFAAGLLRLRRPAPRLAVSAQTVLSGDLGQCPKKTSRPGVGTT